MNKYKQIDISGDVGLRIWGESLENLFENAASGMFNLITDPSRIHGKDIRKLALESDNYEHMLVQWLNELVFLYDTYGFIGKKFQLNIEESPKPDTEENILLSADMSGGIYNPEIHESRLLIKAATYHNLSLKKVKSLWEATVIFDI